MNNIIYIRAEEANKYDTIQYDNFLRITKLFKKFVFAFDIEFWRKVVIELENVLSRCDQIDYQSDETAFAYALLHFLDRYHRVQIMCKFLLENSYLNRAKNYDIIDVGTGPSQVLFALSDHFLSLNRIEGKTLCSMNPEYVEQSSGFRNFLHHFVEFAHFQGVQYLVPFHLGRTKDVFGITFDECKTDFWRTHKNHNNTIKYRYDITVFNNFLTTKVFVEKLADTLREFCKYTRNHGLIIVIGASEKSKKYKEIYPAIDKIVLAPVVDKRFWIRWDKVLEHEFNYYYNDKYGEVLRGYFCTMKNFLYENNLWESVTSDAKKYILQMIASINSKSTGKELSRVTWKMVVYRKISKPKFHIIMQAKPAKNFSRLIDDKWKCDCAKMSN